MGFEFLSHRVGWLISNVAPRLSQTTCRSRCASRSTPTRDGVAFALADGAILFVDAHGPDVFVAPEFLEAQGRMPGILLEQPAGPASRLTGDGIEAGTAVQPRSREMLRRSAPALGRTPTERFLGPEGRWKLASYEVAGTVGWLVILSRRDNGHFPRPFRTNCLANVFQPPCGWLISGVAPRRAVRDRGFATSEANHLKRSVCAQSSFNMLLVDDGVRFEKFNQQCLDLLPEGYVFNANPRG